MKPKRNHPWRDSDRRGAAKAIAKKAARKAKAAEKRERAKAIGLCQRCWVQRVGEGSKTACDACREKNHQYYIKNKDTP